MYENIYLPLDNSEHSNVAAELGLDLAKILGSQVIGSHAYAAALHDVRFKQMEFTLPDEYKVEGELEKQRRIHDSLITRGLVLISDSYLVRWSKRAEELGVEFSGKRFDGKNFQVIVEDIEASNYDLVVLGALGQGAVRDSEAGSVCERVLRRIRVDSWIIRDVESASEEAKGAKGGAVVACLDGSRHSFGGLRSAIELAKSYNKHLDLVTVGSLPSNGNDWLDAAWKHAQDQGVVASSIRLTGRPVASLIEYAERTGAWLLVAGRLGADGDDSMDIGSTTERLIRRAPCNVFVSNRPVDL